MVEGDGGAHLAGDQQRDEGGGAELRHEMDAEHDIERAEDAAGPGPPGYPGDKGQRRQGLAQRGDDHGHGDEADEIADEAGPGGGVQRIAQIAVEDLLDDEADPGQHGEGDGQDDLDAHARRLLPDRAFPRASPQSLPVFAPAGKGARRMAGCTRTGVAPGCSVLPGQVEA
jgi:hypothetical protein